MLLLFICLISFAVIEFFVNRKKKISLCFVIYFISLSMLFFGSLIYITKFQTYHGVSDIENTLRHTLNKIHLNLSTISQLINASIAIFMLNSVYCAHVIHRLNPKVIFFFVIPVLAYFLLFDPTVTYTIFIEIQSGSNYAVLLNVIIPILNYLFKGLLILYMMLPIGIAVRKYFSTDIHILRLNTLFSIVALLIIYIYTFFCFIIGKFSIFMPWKVSLLKFPAGRYIGVSYTFLLFITTALSLTVVYFTLCNEPIRKISDIDDYLTKRKFDKINGDLRVMFHANKNILLAIQKLAKQLEHHLNNPSEVISISNDIKNTAAIGLETLTNSLHMTKNIVIIKEKRIKLLQCLYETIELLPKSETLKITTNFPQSDVYISASQQHIRECMLNFLNNSVDAIEEAKRRFGEISISVKYEENYACIEIKDNGCGIDKKNIKKIFHLMYSTKSPSSKWGTGLYYAKKIIRAYGGFVYVKSKKGEFTTFQITLPISSNKNLKGDINYDK